MSTLYKARLRKKRKFILTRLTELSVLPENKDEMTEIQKKIYDEIYEYNFDYWEKVKMDNGWTTTESKKGEEEQKKSERRKKVRGKLREYGILPQYGEPLTEEQQEMIDKLDRDDYQFYEDIKYKRKQSTITYKKPVSVSVTTGEETRSKSEYYYKDQPGYTANSLPKVVFFKLRQLQILPLLGSEMNEEQIEIVKDVNENWFGKKKGYFIEKYLHLSTPEGRLLFRLYKSHQDFGFNFNLEHSDIIIPEYCPILNIKLSTNPNDKDEPHYFTGDRIDSSKGLVKGNLQVISMRANKMKSKATEAELLQFAANALKLFGGEK